MKIKNYRRINKNGNMPVIKGRGKRCPFCGGDDLSFNISAIRCDKCGARGPLIPEKPQQALEGWNKRYFDQLEIEIK